MPQSGTSLLGTITTELDKISPRFEVQPTQIQILQSPAEFYEALKVSSTFSGFSYNFTKCLHLAIPELREI
jgi:hypothetical protein